MSDNKKINKTIDFRDVNDVARTLHAVLTMKKPDRLTAVCAMIELAIATLSENEPLKHALKAAYTKHVKPQKSTIVLPFGTELTKP